MLSEKLQLPFALIIDVSDLNQPSRIPAESRINPPPKHYLRDITQHVLCPPFCKYQRDVLQCKLSGGNWKGIAKPSFRSLSEALPEKWKPIAEEYAIIFEALRSVKGEIAAGDTGLSTLFALPPYECIDVTTYMGGSVPLALGSHMAGVSPAWAISGDFSFIAAGHLGLLEAVQRQIPLKILLLYNGKAETTGGQAIPEGLLDRILLGYKEYVCFIHDPWDRGEVVSAINKASLSEELSLVVADFRESQKGFANRRSK